MSTGKEHSITPDSAPSAQSIPASLTSIAPSPSGPPGIIAHQEIEELMRKKQLIHNGDLSHIEACSYDLMVGTIFKDGQIINKAHPKANDQVIVNPGEIISILTEEELDLPANIAAFAYAMNQQSSNGLLVLNPGHIDPGYHGPITVKALNLRKTALAISRGTPIFTVVFERLAVDTKHPYTHNMNRVDHEREFNARDVEVAPRSLGDLIILSKDAPFPNRNEVESMIRQSWIAWATLILTFFAALAGILAVYATYHTSAPDVKPQIIYVQPNSSTQAPPATSGSRSGTR